MRERKRERERGREIEGEREEISGIRCQKVTFDDDEYSRIIVSHQKKMSERDGRALFETKLRRIIVSSSFESDTNCP